MMKNQKLLYGILIVVVVVGIGLFILSKPTTTPTTKGQIIVKQSGGAGLLISECGDRNYISNTADYIIEGTVEKVESKWNEERTSIFTYSDLTIEKYVKGTPFTENKLQIVTPGGTVGEISQWVENQPIFHEGKRVRIYFQKTNGEFSIVCAQMGVEEITTPTTKEEPPEKEAGLPNPASVYCKEQGYKLEIRTKPEGQYGVCIFPDNTECEEWSFFRGRCGQKFTFCEQQGFRIENRIDNMGNWTAEYAVCIFDDSSECLEQKYLEDKCNRSECKKWKMSEGGCIKSQ